MPVSPHQRPTLQMIALKPRKLKLLIQDHSQLVKCLLWEHEDPSSDPQSHCEKLRVVAYVYNPSTREAEIHRSLELSDQLVTPISELWVRLETLYQNIK